MLFLLLLFFWGEGQELLPASSHFFGFGLVREVRQLDQLPGAGGVRDYAGRRDDRRLRRGGCGHRGWESGPLGDGEQSAAGVPTGGAWALKGKAAVARSP